MVFWRSLLNFLSSFKKETPLKVIAIQKYSSFIPMSYLTTEDQPETTMLAAEQAAISGNIQQNVITGILAKDVSQQACMRWHLKQAQWYKWQELFGKPTKTKNGYIIDAEQIAIFDCLRSHINEGGNYKSFQAELDKEMVRAEIVPVSRQDIQTKTDEGEFVEVEVKTTPRAIQERTAIAKIAEYRMAGQLREEDLDADLQEAIAKEKDAYVGKFNKRRSPEQFDLAIADMMNLMSA